MNEGKGNFRVGVDIGGTFTDIVLINEEGRLLTRKVSSSVDDYARAIVDGLGQVFDEAGVEPSEILEVMHGTTVASNAILEMKGARVGLIGTDGFRDILEIRNLRMPRLYDLEWVKPPPLVERYLRVVVPERIDAYGKVEKALERAAAEAAVDRLLAEEVEAIAVCLLNSYANPSHEQLIAEVIEARAPDLPYCISFDVLPEIKEYERTSTTVVNAYVLPIVSRYLASLEENFASMGVEAPVLLMQSNGGLTPAAEAARKPVNIVESGPAGGVVGAWSVAREIGHEDVVSFDMGGTTAKASLIENGVYTRSQEYSVGGGIMLGSRLLTGAGYLLKVPAIDLAEVGAGGGSLVWIDAAGSLRIGPESAGADPGPVCYDAGGDRPTVTDANVILGYLNPDHLCGGDVKLNAGKARYVFRRDVAEPLDLELAHAAYGARQIAVSNMIRAIRAVSTERGRDPRRAVMLTFGGSGALFAVDMAEALGMTRIVVPPHAGLFSAFGLLYADIEHYYARTVQTLLSDADPAVLAKTFDELEAKASHQLAADGFEPGEMVRERLASLHYKGQIFELTVPLPDGPLDAAALGKLEVAFGDEHETTYGHRAGSDEPVELVNAHVVGRGAPRGRRSHGGYLAPDRAIAHPGSREAYFGPGTGWLDTPVLSRPALENGVEGPCIVEEYDSTCLIPPGAGAKLDASGNIRIDLAAR